jgi:hypothetical protein
MVTLDAGQCTLKISGPVPIAACTTATHSHALLHTTNALFSLSTAQWQHATRIA